MTVYSSQGLTIDGDVFVYYTSGMDRANTYVACSRHKDNCHLFINKKEIDIGDKSETLKQLVNNMSNDNQSNLAIECMQLNSEKIQEYSMAI